MYHGVNESIDIIDMIIWGTSERSGNFNVAKVAFGKSSRVISNVLNKD